MQHWNMDLACIFNFVNMRWMMNCACEEQKSLQYANIYEKVHHSLNYSLSFDILFFPFRCIISIRNLVLFYKPMAHTQMKINCLFVLHWLKHISKSYPVLNEAGWCTHHPEVPCIDFLTKMQLLKIHSTKKS